MKRSRLLRDAIVSTCWLGLAGAALPAAGQGAAVPGVIGTPVPQVSVKVEPEQHGFVLYAPISRSTSSRSGTDDGAQLSLKLLISNTGVSTLHLKKTTVKFAGPPFAAAAAFETVQDIAANATATVHLQDNVLLPGVHFNFMLSDPPPHHVIIELKFQGYNEVVSLSRPLAPHQNAPAEGSYLFPGEESDLSPGEFWGGSSAGVSSHHTGDERLDYDMGVVKWDANTNKWSGTRSGTDGTANEDFLVWGKPLYAVASGVVESITRNIPDHPPGDDTGSANVFRLRVGDEVVQYLHLRQNSIPAWLNVGDPVAAGQLIGEVGNTGHSSSPHLHIGVRYDPAGMPPQLRPLLFRDIHLIERTEPDPDNVGDGPWEPVDGRSLTWVKNLIWPSSAPPM